MLKRKPMQPKQSRLCAQCGRKFLIGVTRIANSQSGLVFCSKPCHGQYRTTHEEANATCHYCGKTFHRAPSELKRSDVQHAYCCRNCYDKARQEDIAAKRRPVGRWGKHPVACANCGETFYIKPSIFKSRQQIYCSRQCKGKGMQTSRSHASRVEMREQHNCCQVCGLKEPEILEIHHLDGRHSNNNPNNLLMVCPNCHTRLHKGLIAAPNKNG